MTAPITTLRPRDAPGRATADRIDPETVLSALDDPDCRAILQATTDRAYSASELSARCDLPRSTTYRKLDCLASAGLLESGVRIRPSGHHTTEYTRAYDDVVIELADDGVTVELVRTGSDGPDQGLTA
ncbi:MAG: helix-turn-helix domain-containing protein [Haloarculaceae archaeon]